ncbi:hypothetical protein [Hymenobacter terricola]|uniref:hypothetical protein n=1 Tax=Hymenobacter terricola TaxID=2819236 RepID=UPI001B317B87|nr:hypothetical protein [Hymenobacter terricola]
MRRVVRRWGWGLAMTACLLPAARAQTVPVPAASPAAPVASPRPDSVKTPPPTFVVDTARHVVVVNSTEPTTAVTRRTGLRIGAVIVVLTLTTLLLYNVRSR